MKFLKALWDEPKLVAKLLIKSNINDIKNYLAPFFCNNFYQNIISPHTVQDNLLFVITIMIKEEINKLNSIENLNNFLDKTPCGYLLGEFKNKSDIKTFAKTIILKVIKDIDLNSSMKKLNLNIINLVDEIKEIDKKLKNKKKDIGNFEDFIFVRNINVSLGDDIDFESFKLKNKKETDIFNDKYVSNLTKNELDKLSNITYKNEKNMNEYILKQKRKCEQDVKLFTNENLINSIFDTDYSKVIYFFYQIDFIKIINVLNILINTFEENIKILPKSLKEICKIISILIKKKFPDISKIDENNFLVKFLFINLFVPIFKNPIDIYINDFIISENTLFNLRYIINIFTTLITGNFYNNKQGQFHFTPFNWYFIEKMPTIFKLFENIINIKLPIFIENFLNDQLPNDYIYDYFKENPEEMISHRSIFFTLNDLHILLKNMDDNKHILFTGYIENIQFNNNIIINNDNNIINNNIINNNIINNNIINNDNNIINNDNNIINNDIINNDNNIINKENENIIINNNNDNNDDNEDKIKNNVLKIYKIFSKKLNNTFYKNLLKSMRTMTDFEVIEYDEKKTITIPNCLLIYDILINPKYEKLLNIKQKKQYFYIKELNNIDNDDDSSKNNIIKAKNYISGLLYNCRDLEKSDFSSQNDTLKILEEMRIFLRTHEFVLDNTLPYEWYINSLKSCLSSIKGKLAENDYELLYNELENEINESIRLIDFYLMSNCFGKIKYINKHIEFYLQAIDNVKDIDTNIKVKNIIEKRRIPIQMIFKFNNNEREFSLLKPPSKQKKNFDELFVLQNKKYSRICLNIEQFIKYFPNLVKLQLKSDIQILTLINNLQIPKKIVDYINYILYNLAKDNKNKIEDFSSIKDKLFDYILIKLYDKLYPAYPEEEDILILKNCYKLSWCKPKHFIESAKNKKNNNYDLFLDEINQYFTELEMEKSPRKKMIQIDKISQIIKKIIEFNGEDSNEAGADDIMPVFLYLFVRAQPKKIYSDLEYIKLFITDNNGQNQVKLTYFVFVSEILLSINHNNLINVSEEEFNMKCNSSLIKIDPNEQKIID